MCLLICLHRRDGSLVIAANRDERYDRPTRPPFVWETHPPLLAGRDEVAGGTWLALSARGVVAAITNRPTLDGDDPTRPSRGQLPLLACGCDSAASARSVLQEHLRAVRYNGFNLLVAEAGEGFVIQCPAAHAAIEDLRVGVHVVANGGWNDPSDPRVARARTLLGEREIYAARTDRDPEVIADLRRICRDHQGAADRGTLCMHGQSAGTVSSTIIAVDADGRVRRHLHAEGPPCQSEYHDLTELAQFGG